jgi:hypothetical protein
VWILAAIPSTSIRPSEAMGASASQDVVAVPEGRVQAASYHPTGGPLHPKKALVIDPYAEKDTDCHEDVPDADCYRDRDGRVEGAIVAATLGTHPQISVDYIHAGTTVDWTKLTADLPTYDIVHLASHGASNCNPRFQWIPFIEFDDFVDPTNMGNITNQAWDPTQCYSVSTVARRNDPNAVTAQSQLPAGLAAGTETWIATTDFWTGRFNPEAIVYFSFCTSAQGQLAQSGQYGTFIGWHSYARLSVAAQAGITFWEDMATHGTNARTAIAHLAEEDLVTTTVAGWDGVVVHAALTTGGRNQRARDVITSFDIGNLVLEGEILQPDFQKSRVGDSEDEILPEVRFRVEGVRKGTEGDVRIELRLADADPLTEADRVTPHPITLEDARVVEEGPLWNDWEVVVRDMRVPFDLQREDIDPRDPTEYIWEARVYEDDVEYSAHRAERVTFMIPNIAEAEISYMNQLEQIPNTRLLENVVRIMFPSRGGEVFGSVSVILVGTGPLEGTFTGLWGGDLTGTYDAESGEMALTAQIEAQGLSFPAGFEVSNSDGGAVTGVVDWDSGTIPLTFQFGDPQLTIVLVFGPAPSDLGLPLPPGDPPPDGPGPGPPPSEGVGDPPVA